MEDSGRPYNLRRRDDAALQSQSQQKALHQKGSSSDEARSAESDNDHDEAAADLDRMSGKNKRSFSSGPVNNSSPEPPAKRRRLASQTDQPPTTLIDGSTLACVSCGTTSSTQWRKSGIANGLLCNSCGIKLSNERTRRGLKNVDEDSTAGDEAAGADASEDSHSDIPDRLKDAASPVAIVHAQPGFARTEPVYLTKSDRKELLKILREVRPVDNETIELRRENEKLRSELLEMTQKRAEDQIGLARLHSDLESARAQSEQARETLQSLRDQCFKLEELNYTLSTKLEKAESDLDSFKEAIAATSEADLQRRLTAREKENEELKTKLASLEAEMAAVRQNSQKLQESLANEMRTREQVVLQQQQLQQVQQQQQQAVVAQAQAQAQQQQQQQQQQQAAQQTQAQQQATLAQQQQMQYMSQLHAAQMHGQIPYAYAAAAAAMYGGLPRGYPTAGIAMSPADLMKMGIHPGSLQYAAATNAAAAAGPTPGQTS